MRLKLPSVLSRRAGLAAAALLVVPFVAAGPAALAQDQAQASSTLLATPLVRVTTPVENDALVTLKGNTHPMAQARYDQGAASTSLATGKLQLLLRRSPAQQVALREYLGSLQDPHSASFHKWLTPQSYGASFGIADQDLQTVENWLQSQGFKIEGVPASRNLIQFSGTTGQIAQAFHTSIHSYLVNGVKHYSNASDPQIPAALSPVVAGISPMNDFRAKPLHVLGAHSQAVAKNGSLQVVTQPGTGAKSALTVTEGSTPTLLLTPSDAATIYNAANSLNRNYTGAAQQNGQGVNIGVAEYSDIQTADYLNYRRLFLNETNPVAPTLVVDGVDPGVLYEGDGGEALLDVEMEAALAPKANIFAYSSNSDLVDDGLTNAIIRAIEDNIVSVLSISYGNCEENLGTSGNLEISELWEEAAAQGITVAVATGDSGSAACDQGTATGQAVSGLTVSGFASTPYNVAVGGTDFDILATNFSQYVAAEGATNPSSTAFYGSALSYIPENPWNDSISNNPPGAFTSNVPAQYNDGTGTPSFTILDAGGGGASSAALCNGAEDQNGNCLGLPAGYPTPPFQTGISVGTAAPAGVRYLPDVSLFAAPGSEHPVAWAYCSDSALDESTQNYTDCVPGSDGSFNIEGIGGTSASTPAFAGMLAQVIQNLPTVNGQFQRLGLANNVLYNLFNKSANNGSIFHDVAVGNNSVPCAANTPSCASNGFVTGYNATTGYDPASGLGSVNVAALVTAWPTATFTATGTTLTLNGGTTPITITHGANVTIASTVTPSTATGIVSVTGQPTGQGAAALNAYVPLTSGTGSITADYLPGGTYTVQAYYPGDVSDSPSTSNPPIQVTVNPEASVPFLSLQIEDLATGNPPTGNPIPYGEYGFAYVEPGNTNATTAGYHGSASGTATLLNNGTSLATQTLNSQGAAAFPIYGFAPGTYSLGASYSGDASYSPSSTTANVALSITKAPTALSIKAASSSIAASASTTVLVTLSTDSAGAYPGGPITLTSGNTSFQSSVAAGTTTTGADAYFATFTVPGTSLASGANTLTAAYGGDTNYLGAGSVSTVINVSGTSGTSAGFSLTSAPSTVNISTPGQSGTATVSIAPTNGFTGAVNLTCTLASSGLVKGLPSCTVTPSVNVAAGTAATATVTINTTAQTAALAIPGNNGASSDPLHRLLAVGGGATLCSVLLFCIPARRKAWRSMLMAMIALIGFGALGMMGCGGTSTNNGTGTQVGTYTATVTGTSGTTTANTNITINVQ